MRIPPDTRLVFVGDSITDCGRRDSDPPLGCGYVRMAADLITARYPGHGVRVVNTGISGNTVKDLTPRWTEDVINHDPDWLSVMIGINDVHRYITNQGAAAVSPSGWISQSPFASVVMLNPPGTSTSVPSNSVSSFFSRANFSSTIDLI